MFRYAWPLNIRELEQALGATVAMTDTGEIHLEHSPKRSGRTSRARTAMLPEVIACRG